MLPERIEDAFLEAAEVDGLGVGFWLGPGRIDHWTYRKLATEATAFAAGLQSRGIRPGQRVALVLSTGPEFYIAWFGCILAGAVPTALYPPARLGRVAEWRTRTAQMLSTSSSVMVVTEPRLYAFLGAPVAEADPEHGCTDVATLVELGRDQQLQTGHSGELAAVQFSSGSTGKPKPVALSHSNMLSNARSILSRLPGDPSKHHGVSWLPLYHDMGLIGCLLAALVGKTQITMLRPEHFVANPVSWLQAISETRATVSVAPNFAFGLTEKRVRDSQLENLDLSSWSVAMCGAEPVHPDTLDRFVSKFAPCGFRREAITPVYGLAEATLAVSFSPVATAPRWTVFEREALESNRQAIAADQGLRVASLGTPLDCQIEIRNEAGCKLPEQKVGAIHLRGPGVMLGYLDQPKETSKAIDPEGWLNTGDVGFLYQGELYLCGRAKDLVIIRGRNHDPAFIEQGLEGVEGVREGCSAAFAVLPEEADTEAIVVVAERHKNSTVDNDLLRANCLEAIQEATSLKVHDVQLVEPGTLPRTSSGKIRRSTTRQLYLSSQLSAPERANLRLVVREQARGYFHHTLRRLRGPARKSA
ncbi:MAG: AMP-dependent synthetase [Rickettsiales bacterium]|nr:AMP-dependent synthetase [Rickettsiales bacterium]